MKIQNIRNVKLFTLGELFKIETGKDLIYRDLSSGKYPVVSHTALNNGVNCYTEYLEDYKLYNHNKTIALGDRGNFFASVQTEDFYVGTRVKTLYAKFNYSNIFILMYIATLINKEQFRFAYGRNATDKTESIEILLPVIKNNKNKYEPDWHFMEYYIKEKYDEIEKEFKTKNSNDYKEINKENWKEFKIGGFNGLFDIKLSKGDLKIDACPKGSIPLISSGDTNNGNVGFIDEDGDGKAEIFPKDTITVDMFGKAYYQPDNYFAVSHGRVNVLIPRFKINKAIGLFIVTIINNEQYRFEYGRAVYSNVISDMIIKLPAIKKDNDEYEPNWKYMEDYIKSLPYGDLI